MQTEISKRTASRYFEMWNTGNIQIADEILSASYIDHAHPEIKSVDMVKESVLKIRNMFPDFQIKIDTLISEGNTVALEGTVYRSQQGKITASKVMWFLSIDKEKITELRTGTVTQL
jgi:predicted ester cyclase